jgi:hypothetical protein
MQCLHRWQKVLRPGLRKGPWSAEEDCAIRACVDQGLKKWSDIAVRLPGPIGKQCSERWHNHLDPTVKKSGWLQVEDALLLWLQKELGNKWGVIATRASRTAGTGTCFPNP